MTDTNETITAEKEFDSLVNPESIPVGPVLLEAKGLVKRFAPKGAPPVTALSGIDISLQTLTKRRMRHEDNTFPVCPLHRNMPCRYPFYDLRRACWHRKFRIRSKDRRNCTDCRTSRHAHRCAAGKT